MRQSFVKAAWFFLFASQWGGCHPSGDLLELAGHALEKDVLFEFCYDSSRGGWRRYYEGPRDFVFRKLWRSTRKEKKDRRIFLATEEPVLFSLGMAGSHFLGILQGESRKLVEKTVAAAGLTREKEFPLRPCEAGVLYQGPLVSRRGEVIRVLSKKGSLGRAWRNLLANWRKVYGEAIVFSGFASKDAKEAGGENGRIPVFSVRLKSYGAWRACLEAGYRGRRKNEFLRGFATIRGESSENSFFGAFLSTLACFLESTSLNAWKKEPGTVVDRGRSLVLEKEQPLRLASLLLGMWIQGEPIDYGDWYGEVGSCRASILLKFDQIAFCFNGVFARKAGKAYHLGREAWVSIFFSYWLKENHGKRIAEFRRFLEENSPDVANEDDCGLWFELGSGEYWALMAEKSLKAARGLFVMRISLDRFGFLGFPHGFLSPRMRKGSGENAFSFYRLFGGKEIAISPLGLFFYREPGFLVVSRGFLGHGPE